MKPTSYSYSADRNTFGAIVAIFVTVVFAIIGFAVHTRVDATMKKGAAIPAPECGWSAMLVCDDNPGVECHWEKRWRCGYGLSWPSVTVAKKRYP